MGRSSEYGVVLQFLPSCSTRLNIYVLDKAWRLQGGACLPAGGRLESVAAALHRKKNPKNWLVMSSGN